MVELRSLITRRSLIFIPILLLSLVASGCGDTISADTCDELADETMELIQRLIDDVDSEFDEMSVEEFMISGGELPSIEAFYEDSATIDEIALELGCTQSQIGSAVRDRVGELSAESDLGRFLIDAIIAGGL